MQVHEYARNHGLTTAKVTQLCRAGRIKARRIGTGNLGFWDIVELWEPFENITVELSSKDVGGSWRLCLTYQDGRYAITSRDTSTNQDGTTVVYDDADEATDAYRDHEWDPERTADPLNPTPAAVEGEPVAVKPQWREWIHPVTGQRRRYLTNAADIIGLHLRRYNTGNVAYAELNGRTIANGQAGRILTLIDRMRIWADEDNQVYYHSCDSSNRYLDHDDIINAVTAAM